MPYYNLVYLVYHLSKHIHSGGVGLRSILDIGLYIKHVQDRLNQKELEQLLSRGDFTRFFQTVVYLSHVLFDTPMDLSLMKDFSMDPETTEAIIAYIAKSGIHGVGSAFDSFSPRIATLQRKQKSKYSLLFNRLFPKYSEMKNVYPRLKTYPVFLPLYWMKRALRLIFANSKKNRIKIKSILKSTESKQAEDMFQKMGL